MCYLSLPFTAHINVADIMHLFSTMLLLTELFQNVRPVVDESCASLYKEHFITNLLSRHVVIHHGSSPSHIPNSPSFTIVPRHHTFQTLLYVHLLLLTAANPKGLQQFGYIIQCCLSAQVLAAWDFRDITYMADSTRCME